MDFIGDETAVRHALEVAAREHARRVKESDVSLDSLPDVGVARVFIDELNARGWKLEKKE